MNTLEDVEVVLLVAGIVALIAVLVVFLRIEVGGRTLALSAGGSVLLGALGLALDIRLILRIALAVWLATLPPLPVVGDAVFRTAP